MAKLPTPTGNSWDMGNTFIVYADGMDEVDQYGPNARLTFWMVQRDSNQPGGATKAVMGRVIIPTAELVRVVPQLCTLDETPTDASEQPKEVVTLQ
jgi:hypothetical protein